MSKHYGAWTNDGSLAADETPQRPTADGSATSYANGSDDGRSESVRKGRGASVSAMQLATPPALEDPALYSPASLAPGPSAVEVSTTGAFGHPTRALATCQQLR